MSLMNKKYGRLMVVSQTWFVSLSANYIKLRCYDH